MGVAEAFGAWTAQTGRASGRGSSTNKLGMSRKINKLVSGR
jgi:hypothetical protein